MQINRLSRTSGHVFEVKKMAKSKKSISFGQKLDIITDIEKGETQASVCRRLDLSKTTVSTIWRSRELQFYYYHY